MKILAARLNWSSRSSLSAHWWTDLVASSARWRAVCSSREVGGVDKVCLVWWTLAGAGPGFLRGVGRTAGAFLGLLNQPSSDGATGNAIGRRFVPLSALCRARGAGGWWCRPFPTGSQKIIIWCVGCGASRSSSMCCAGRGDCRKRKPPRASPAGANCDATAKAISRRRLPK